MSTLSYNGVALSSLGLLEIDSLESQPMPPESPSYRVNQLRVRVTLVEPQQADNLALFAAAVAATGTVGATLAWTDERGLVRYSGHATCVEERVGELAPGAYRAVAAFTFRWQANSVASAHGGITLSYGGGPTVLALGTVEKWTEDWRNSRFSDMRSTRRRTGGFVACAGVMLAADPSASVATQRTDLLAKAAAWRTAMQGQKEVTLAYGGFSKVVRVSGFRAEVDDAREKIRWSFEADYTLFPDEAGYAVCDVSATPVENRTTGVLELKFAGKIGAQSEAAAITKLGTLRGVFVPGTHVCTAQSRTSANIEGDADGSAFVELSFDETWQKAASGILDYEVRTATSVDRANGTKKWTYSGSVRAHASTAAGAATIAIAKAQAVGAIGSGALLRVGEQENCVTAVEKATGGDIVVRCDFSYEYVGASGFVWKDYKYESVVDTFGQNTVRIAGYVAAPGSADLEDAYAEVRAGMAAGLVLNEQTSDANVESGSSSMSVRRDFQITTHAAHGFSAVQYGIEVDDDLVAATRRTTISGTVVAVDAATATTYLNTLLGTLSLGTKVRGNRRTDTIKGPDLAYSQVSAFVRLTFTESYDATLTGLSGILQTELTEDVQYSATRWVERPIPDGVSVIQNCGTASGMRRVTGQVTALTETAARDWIYARRSLLTLAYEQPPRITTRWAFGFQVAGIPRGGSANFRVCVVGFEFSEILVDYPLVIPPP